MSAGNNAGKSFWEMDELRIVSGAMVILGGATALMVVVPIADAILLVGGVFGLAPVPTEQAQAALAAATERLGAPGKLSIQGDRVLLTLKSASAAQLTAWLAEARVGARARVVDATLSRAGPGLWDGNLTLTLGTNR